MAVNKPMSDTVKPAGNIARPMSVKSSPPLTLSQLSLNSPPTVHRQVTNMLPTGQ